MGVSRGGFALGSSLSALTLLSRIVTVYVSVR